VLQTPKSKTGQLAEFLRAKLDAGEWGDTVPPERSLAEDFMVSRTTLRNALDLLQSEGVIGPAGSSRHGRPVLKRKRGAAIRGSGELVVVITQTLHDNSLLLEHLAIMRELLGRGGVRIEVQEAAHLADMKQPESALARITSKHARAVWVLHKMPQAVQLAAQSLGLRCVVYGSTSEGVDLPFVDMDYGAVARHATGRCISKGFSKIAVLVHRTPLAGDAVVVREVTDQLARAGAPPPTVLRYNFNRSRLIDGLDQRIVHVSDRPQVLLVVNQHHLLTALSHLLRCGLKIPGDLSLIYLSNDPVTERLSPLPDRYDLGSLLPRRLAKSAQAMLSGEHPPGCRLLPKMLIGESFGLPPALR